LGTDTTIVICFPISILCQTRISLRQKVILSSIFCLVGFTIAVTIVRGSIFGGVYKELDKMDRKVLDTAWCLFWFYIEFMVCKCCPGHPSSHYSHRC
jgi:hypothetical protein